MNFKNIIFYNNNFYTDSQNNDLIYIHNRLKDEEYLFKLLNITQIKLKDYRENNGYNEQLPIFSSICVHNQVCFVQGSRLSILM